MCFLRFVVSAVGQSDEWVERTERLLEKTSSKKFAEGLGQLNVIETISRDRPKFLGHLLNTLAGVRTIDVWGQVLAQPFSAESFEEIILWRTHPNRAVRYTVYNILCLYIEDPGTPLEPVQDHIAPLVAQARSQPHIDQILQATLDQCSLAARVRSVSETNVIGLLREELQDGTNEMYVVRLLAIAGNREAIEIIRDNRKRINESYEYYDVCLEIAELNHALKELPSDQHRSVLEAVIGGARKHDSTRAYALWMYWKHHGIQQHEKLLFILETYKSQGAQMDSALAAHFWDVIQKSEDNPELLGKLKQLGVDPKGYRLVRPKRTRSTIPGF